MRSVEIRSTLADVLDLDLIGPRPGEKHERETLPQAPSRWYLTGFLVPREAPAEQRHDPTAEEGAESVEGEGSGDDSARPDNAAARVVYFPSSMGLSVLLGPETTALTATVTWGDYRRMEAAHEAGEPPPPSPSDGEPDPDLPPSTVEGAGSRDAAPRSLSRWLRTPGRSQLVVDIPGETDTPIQQSLPQGHGLQLVLSVRGIGAVEQEGLRLPPGTRVASLFVVNARPAAPDDRRDEAFAFQVELALKCAGGFIARPSRRRGARLETDDRIANLQYRDAAEFAVGHGIATHAPREPGGRCHEASTTWIPRAEVEKVEPARRDDVELGMEALANIATGAELKSKVGRLAHAYREWIVKERETVWSDLEERATAVDLLRRAEVVCGRIADGLELLGTDAEALSAFRIANLAMARAARARSPREYSHDKVPTWRPFQLAFLLMNLRGLAEPDHPDRRTVDLLFFPTGGGKTEAYLGIAAFTLVLRRLRRPGLASAGVGVLMRYTLRLLTLDQLGRAAALICALELMRQDDVEKLGPWPFEIGLWVGQAATPNRMGKKGDNDKYSARAKTIAFRGDSKGKPAPIPLESCPWCGTRFSANSFTLEPNEDHPDDLKIVCLSRTCTFRGKPLPIVAVDEPLYRRLPCFLIATVDKFASLPWVGPSGALLGGADRQGKSGFYGASEPHIGSSLPQPLLPPDLIIQDELHLISGPLGTMVGLYETALDALCERPGTGGESTRPKIIASTATVRRAEQQIKSLFNRSGVVDIFPPPLPNRRHSFFAETVSPETKNARLYLGIAAPGRSLRFAMLRTYLALLSAAQKAYEAEGGARAPQNSADPYMTLLGYFNSLRELGGSRRIVEDEVSSSLQGFAGRRRVGETESPFANRTIKMADVVELTSRKATSDIAEAKRRLAETFVQGEKDSVDVAIATNMISVGLDITRLGLMVVLGQPKTTAEYIQATSRVGRSEERPGLVISLLNIHRPRDRSHYERFEFYHETFYRAVEATSVTPFSPRAVDRGIAAISVALARHGNAKLTPPVGADAIREERGKLGFVLDAIGARAEAQPAESAGEAQDRRDKLRARVADLLDEWTRRARELNDTGGRLQYQQEVGAAKPLLYDALDPETLTNRVARKFRARRSLRDVEPNVNLYLRTLDGNEIELEEEGT